MIGMDLNSDAILNILKDFYNLTGIRVAFVSHDRKEIVVWPKEMSDFCNKIRKDKNIDTKCINCDKEALEKAKNEKSIYQYTCHIGLREAISPIVYDDKLLGYLMMGQIMDVIDKKFVLEKVKYINSFSKDEIKDIEKAIMKLRCVRKDNLKSAANILGICAKHIYSSEFIKVRSYPVVKRVEEYINDKYKEDISIKDIAQILNISDYYLSHLIKENHGRSFTKLLNDKRINEAKTLLRNKNLSIKEISMDVGIVDSNYFSRIFKKAEGISPREFRNLK